MLLRSLFPVGLLCLALTGRAAEITPEPTEKYDWIQLTSGEWLKGTLQAVEWGQVYFDSDKLGELTLDWDDLQGAYTERVMVVFYGDGQLTVGKLHTSLGRLQVGGPENSIPLAAVIRIALSAPSERQRWYGDASLGGSLRRGTSNELNVDLSFRVKRQAARSTLQMSYYGNYADYDGEVVASDHIGNLAYDYRINRDWFMRPIGIEYQRDPIQNLDQQWTLGVGAGYYFYDQPNITWDLAAGPGYQRVVYQQTEPGTDDRIDTRALYLSSTLDAELTKDIDVLLTYRVIAVKDEAGGLKQRATFAIDFELTDRLDLRLSSYWDKTQNPQPTGNSDAPEPVDLRFSIGIAYDI